MNLFNSLEEAGKSGEIHRLAVGFFDGVHLGHRLVFDAVQDPGEGFSILTFWPHPQSVLAPERAPRLITGLEHKLDLFTRAGARSTILVPFDRSFAGIGAEEFLGLLARHFPGLKVVSCGPNFHFGKNRAGTAARLFDWARTRGIEARVPRMQQDGDGQIISSSRIRNALAGGNIAPASGMLGRPYAMRGTVVKGRQLGRTLGFPTANLESNDDLLLPLGVYAGLARIASGDTYPAALNFGYQPSVDPANQRAKIEAHLLKFNGDLYGQPLEIQPRHFLRKETQFGNLQELQARIARDVEETAGLISGHTKFNRLGGR